MWDVCRRLRGRATFAAFCVVFLGQAVTWAGHFGMMGGGVGGISVDADGVVRNVNVDARNLARAALLVEVKKAIGALNQPVQLRMVSLKGLEAAITDAHKNNLGQLPEEVQFLAGLQRIEFVLVYPEEHDIVLAGPGEGWKVNENASVVGITTGRPVIQLDDLLVALRSVHAARQEGISCSIDPTQQGRQTLDRYLKSVRAFSPDVLRGMQEALGMQQITLRGVPTDSHFARVMVAADYHMKRIAMNLDRSPVTEIPGFLDLMKANNTKLENMMPRWWLACNYEPLLRSEDGLTWQIRGQGVKALTEGDFVKSDGTVNKGKGRKNMTAQKWADLMTTHYSQLSKANATFGELRNIMDMCVVAALIEKEGMLEKAGLKLPLLTDPNNRELTTTVWPAPKGIATQCSFLNTGKEYIVTASGGVQIESWQVAQNSTVSKAPDKIRAKATSPSGKPWWWQ